MLATKTLGPGEEADIRVQLGRALTHVQEWAKGRTELERAIQHLDHDPGARAGAMMILAWPRGTTCPARVHIEWLTRAGEHTAAGRESEWPRAGLLPQRG